MRSGDEVARPRGLASQISDRIYRAPALELAVSSGAPGFDGDGGPRQTRDGSGRITPARLTRPIPYECAGMTLSTTQARPVTGGRLSVGPAAGSAAATATACAPRTDRAELGYLVR